MHRVAWKWRGIQSGRKPRRRAIFSSCVHVGVRVVDEARARVRVRVRAGARVGDRVRVLCDLVRQARRGKRGEQRGVHLVRGLI